MTVVRGPVDGSVAMFVRRGRRPTSLEEYFHHVVVATERSKMDGGTSLVITEGRISPRLKEDIYTLFEPIGRLQGERKMCNTYVES